MATIFFDAVSFRALFPAFANTTTYPSATIQIWWDTATSYLSDQTSYCNRMNVKQQTLALNYMTAHLLYLSGLAITGQSGGIEISSSIDKISVAIAPPPAPNQWQYWLQTSPYGSQLLALLQLAAAGGFFFNPVPVHTAFRG